MQKLEIIFKFHSVNDKSTLDFFGFHCKRSILIEISNNCVAFHNKTDKPLLTETFGNFFIQYPLILLTENPNTMADFVILQQFKIKALKTFNDVCTSVTTFVIILQNYDIFENISTFITMLLT